MADTKIRHKPVNLTETEIKRISLVAQDMSYTEVAEQENVSIETVRSQMKSIFNKLGVSNKLAAVIELQRRKLLTWDRDRKILLPNPEVFGGGRLQQIQSGWKRPSPSLRKGYGSYQKRERPTLR